MSPEILDLAARQVGSSGRLQANTDGSALMLGCAGETRTVKGEI